MSALRRTGGRVAVRLSPPAQNRLGYASRRLLIEPALLQKTWILRKLLHRMDEIAAMGFLPDDEERQVQRRVLEFDER